MKIFLAVCACLTVFISTSCHTICQSGCQQPSHPVPDDPRWLTYSGGKGPGAGKHIVLISADQEYRSEQSMPMMAKILSEHHGFDCTVLYGTNAEGLVDPTMAINGRKTKPEDMVTHNIEGLEHLESADLVIFFTRLLTLPDDQLEHIVNYLDSGKPFICLRTANHGFRGKLPYKHGDRTEIGFGEIVGGAFMKHHGRWHADSTRGSIDPKAKDHPIVQGAGDIWGPSDVYRTYPEGGSLPADCTALVWGQPLMARNYDDPPNKEKEPLPVAWVKEWETSTGKKARVFHSTMGSGKDLQSQGLRRLIVNAVYWGVGKEDKITADSNVDYVGDYQPLVSGFKYEKLGVKPHPVSHYK